ncbi:type I methionyl aminopeptidase [Kyrpidia spormannii]|uniref:Methionine aminopeptidase n=2 Tax=Kyrpidia spormannii TaxID=2055160 RepID=A0A2K8N2D7_9BACL|nr:MULTISPECIES: type I methionyl aminopeptidase [Kyrpidia]HHY66847.1 type I methionyl aminopeptidase [Alicyclobacillus sp.]ATY83714.1 type I methionyl aminopeptidase [Kyrpidia spormannii]MCL6575325.1 type I methionyl aminopeptidase [Kyrpidia sp.]CAB3389354.1 methionine aminopeptidase [Kyrpidia spormannii]CAB3389992.1 methionine aminopeptidase [Kyrpidia spormannii]
MIVSKSKAELEWMREAGRIVALALKETAQAVEPGITTRELDRIAEHVIRRNGAIPSFKGYHGYPASICASVNEELVHGIPGDRKLVEGDIVSIDIGAQYHGYHGDAAITVPVGSISEEARRLLDVTEASLYKGIEKAVVGNRLSDISHAVQVYVEQHGFSVVRDYVGHGVGQEMHEDPQIPNFGPPGHGPRLKPGMVLAIEPMVNAGSYHVKTLPDNWTVVTVDGSLAAHFEHTVAITEGEPEILTRL